MERCAATEGRTKRPERRGAWRLGAAGRDCCLCRETRGGGGSRFGRFRGLHGAGRSRWRLRSTGSEVADRGRSRRARVSGFGLGGGGRLGNGDRRGFMAVRRLVTMAVEPL